MKLTNLSRAVTERGHTAHLPAVFIDAACHIYLFVALLFAMWAVNKDGNDGIASMNAAIVVIAPVVASLSGLISTVVEIIATGAPGLSGLQ